MQVVCGWQRNGKSQRRGRMNRLATDTLNDMVLSHSLQHDDFPDVIIMDRATSYRLKQENRRAWDGVGTVTVKMLLDPEVNPSHFMGIPVEVIE